MQCDSCGISNCHKECSRNVRLRIYIIDNIGRSARGSDAFLPVQTDSFDAGISLRHFESTKRRYRSIWFAIRPCLTRRDVSPQLGIGGGRDGEVARVRLSRFNHFGLIQRDHRERIFEQLHFTERVNDDRRAAQRHATFGFWPVHAGHPTSRGDGVGPPDGDPGFQEGALGGSGVEDQIAPLGGEHLAPGRALVVRADLYADAPAVVLHALHDVGAGVVVGGFSEPRFIGDVHFAVPKLLVAVVVPEDCGVEATTVLRLLDGSTQQSDFGGLGCCGLPGFSWAACGFAVVREELEVAATQGWAGHSGSRGQGGTLSGPYEELSSGRENL